MNKKPNPIHTLPEMIKINTFLFKQHLTNIRLKNLTVTLHQIHCSVALTKTYIMYHQK